jgi:hypothetical protein
MKKLLAVVALVGMVAAASIAQAATVTVSGTFDESLTVNPCTQTTSPWTLTVDTDNTNTCIADYNSNDPDGYVLSFSAASADMEGQGGISGEVITAITGTDCAAHVTADTECFSYTFTVDDAQAGSGVYLTGLNGTVDSNEDDVPTSSAAVFTSAANDEADDTYTFTFHSVPQPSTAAGSYDLDTGAITLVGQ